MDLQLQLRNKTVHPYKCFYNQQSSQKQYNVFFFVFWFLSQEMIKHEATGYQSSYKWLANLEHKKSSYLFFIFMTLLMPHLTLHYPIQCLCWNQEYLIEIILPGKHDLVIFKLWSDFLLNWHASKYIWGLCSIDPESLLFSKTIKNKKLLATFGATSIYFKWKNSTLLYHKFIERGILYFVDIYDIYFAEI